MENKPVPQEKFPKTKIQKSMPIISQEATQEGEGVLKIDNDHISDSVAKESQVDDTVIIKKSIERGESVPRADDVRNFDLSRN